MQAVAGTARYPLSPMQQGMLFHHLLDSHGGADLEQIVGRLQEALDAEAFRRAWEAVAAAEPALRTRFDWHSGVPEQAVEPSVSPRWREEDWRGLPGDEQERRLASFLAEDRRLGFDLASPPLWRVALFSTGDSTSTFVLSFPHILMDGRSFPVILEEAFSAYDAVRRGESWQPPASRPYADHVAWLAGQDRAGAEAFWRGLLAGFSAPLQLPRPTAGASLTGRGEQRATLGRDISERLEQRARDHGLTLNTIVQGCWAILLSRWSGEEDIVFGATRAGRRSALPGMERAVGLFINTLPVRARVTTEERLIPWLQALRAQNLAVRPHEQTPLLDVQRWSDVPGGGALFESIIVFDSASLDTTMRGLGGPWLNRRFELIEQTTYPLTLYGYGEQEMLFKLAYDRDRLSDATAARMLGHLCTLLEAVADGAERTLGELPMLTAAERQTLLNEWNDTATPYPATRCIHHLFQDQVARTPDAVALISGEERLTYAGLNARANRLAHFLIDLGVGPDVLVGIAMERSADTVVAMLAVLKAGGAYLPVDPGYPPDRIAFVIEDAAAPVLLTEERVAGSLPRTAAAVVCVDRQRELIDTLPAADPAVPVAPFNLAYTIYTSGSTGRPKGVMVEHHNVVNFFTGMDERLAPRLPAVWLAVTSLSFDISVLELLWTLTRGFTVVLYSGKAEGIVATGAPAPTTRPLGFSLFYFAADQGRATGDIYDLLIDGATFADRNGFEAVWMPERHFHDFGGSFPNPAVTAAAVAAVTERVQIRAGSVVLPLHSPIRVAEEWSVVDNLSHGRAGISVASGWQPHDFVLRPEAFAAAKEEMVSGIETVRRLWRGESVTFPGPGGEAVSVRTLPRPVQEDLPLWVTAAGNPETFRLAGEIGANVLTHLLGQSLDEVAEKVAVYRRARREAGHPGEGRVTLMLHTFVGKDETAVRELVRQPMKEYLRSSVGLIKGVAWSFPIFKQRAGAVSEDDVLASLSEEEMEALLDYAFERYYETSGLFGTPERCAEIVARVRAIGVDEIGCLIDFGLDKQSVLESLARLNAVKDAAAAPDAGDDGSIPTLIARHGVTHLQCTPSMATMLAADARARAGLRSLRHLLVGGEALPAALAADLAALVPGEVTNMYGPTETTIWSSTQTVTGAPATVPIGRPIANTQFYIVDRHGRLVPEGVPGELLIGGDGVVRGYLNRPELTAERFLPNPFVDDPDARVYRTGDLTRFLPDGTVEFLGRFDHQVKLRGYRIELGEIESHLREETGVQEAVVIAREDTPGDTRLVAYVVPAGAPPPTAQALRSRLAASLPDYMVPAQVVFLDALPLTPNAKIDRKALPRPVDAAADAGRAAGPLARQSEEAVAAVWREVLGVAEVGRDDNFFDLGGHSLLAVQVHRRLSETVGARLALTDLFRFPTVRALADFLDADDGNRAEASALGATRADARRDALARRRERVAAGRV